MDILQFEGMKVMINTNFNKYLVWGYENDDHYQLHIMSLMLLT